MSFKLFPLLIRLFEHGQRNAYLGLMIVHVHAFDFSIAFRRILENIDVEKKLIGVVYLMIDRK